MDADMVFNLEPKTYMDSNNYPDANFFEIWIYILEAHISFSIGRFKYDVKFVYPINFISNLDLYFFVCIIFCCILTNNSD